MARKALKNSNVKQMTNAILKGNNVRKTLSEGSSRTINEATMSDDEKAKALIKAINALPGLFTGDIYETSLYDQESLDEKHFSFNYTDFGGKTLTWDEIVENDWEEDEDYELSIVYSCGFSELKLVNYDDCYCIEFPCQDDMYRSEEIAIYLIKELESKKLKLPFEFEFDSSDNQIFIEF